MVEIGSYRHRVTIYDRQQSQDAGGNLVDAEVSLGSRWARIETRRMGGEQEDGGGVESFFQSVMFLRWDGALVAKLTGTTYFVVETMLNARFEADGPPVDRMGTFREVMIPITQVVPEDLPSQ